MPALWRCVLVTVIVGVWTGCAGKTVPESTPVNGTGVVMDVTDEILKQVPLQQEQEQPEEVLETGDLLEVIVRRGAGEEKYQAVVRSSGKINVAFTDIPVKGLTESRAEDRIAERLSAIIREPRVQVRLTQKGAIGQKAFFILGEIKNGGRIVMTRNTTLLQAIAQGGGPTDVAGLEKVVVFSGLNRSPQIAPRIKMANVEKALVQGDLSVDFPISDADVIFVPRSQIGDYYHYYMKVLLPTLNVLLQATSVVFINKSLEILFATPLPGSEPVVPVCWVARALYGDQAWQVPLLRWYIWGPLSEHWYGRLFADFYLRYGEQVAGFLKQYPRSQVLMRPLFDYLLEKAVGAAGLRQEAGGGRPEWANRPLAAGPSQGRGVPRLAYNP